MSEYNDRIDAICDRFEEDWLSNNRPSIAAITGQSDSALRLGLLENLIPIDIEYRIKQGEEIATDDYADLGPEAVAIAEHELQRNLDRLTNTKPNRDAEHDQQYIPSDLPGSQIGPYKLVEKIGEGGMGSVWLAQQTHPVRRSVALKLSRSFPIPRNLSQSQRAEFQKRLDELANRFESERQTQAVMDHPNIAKVLDAGTTDDKRPYFVMELVDGSPINEYCDNVRATIRQRIDLMIQACKAIQHAHQKGIIHRDIKPSNVLVTTQDNQAIVKVIDFGLAKVTSDADKLLGAPTPTETGLIMGTYLYMSPEQAGINTKDIDTRSDVYSLGVLLFELLTGSTPIDRTRANELIDLQLLAAIREEEPPRPSDRLSKLEDSGQAISRKRQTDVRKLSSILRGELDWIALKALAKDRKRRYDGPAELVEDLQRYLKGEAIVARPPSVRYKLVKALRRYRIAIGTITLTLALIAMGFIATYSQLQRALIAESQSDQNAKQEKAQRILAETNLRRAVDAEAATQDRVKELEELTDFQSNQFLAMDVAVMGVALRNLLRENFEESERGASSDQRVAFDDLLTSLNLVDVSRNFLERNIIKPAINAADQKYANQPKFQASIYSAISVSADVMGIPTLSFDLARKSFELRQLNLGLDHPETLVAMNNMANLLNVQGNSVEAEALHRGALNLRRTRLGNGHTATLTSINNLANFLARNGQTTEAEQLYREVLDGRRNLLGSDHPDTLISIGNFAFFLDKQGNSAEAEPLFRQALEVSRKLLGNDHRDTLTSISYMAEFLAGQGNSSEAEPLYRDALRGRRKQLGNYHPDTLKSINSLAIFLAGQGKSSEAELLYLEALESCRKLFGNENPNTLNSMNNLSIFLYGLGKSVDSETLCWEALAGHRKLLGNDHPDTLNTILSMAGILHGNRKSLEAEPLFREALNGRRKVLGNGHPDTLRAVYNLARFLAEQGELREADLLYQEALDGSRRLLGNEHPDTLRTINSIALFFNRQGKSKEAEPLHAEALAGRRKLLGNEHPDTLASINNMAVFLEEQGRFAEAEPFLRESLNGSRKLLGSEHPSTVAYLSNLAVFLEKRGKFGESESLYRELLMSRRRSFGNEHPETLGCLLNVAGALYKQGNSEEAEPIFREFLDKSRLISGFDPTLSYVALNNLCKCLDNQDKLAEAELHYRELLTLADRQAVKIWQKSINRIRLGSVLIRAKKNHDEAKQLIESAYKELQSSDESVPKEVRDKIFDDASNAIKLLKSFTTDSDQPSSSVPILVDK